MNLSAHSDAQGTRDPYEAEWRERMRPGDEARSAWLLEAAKRETRSYANLRRAICKACPCPLLPGRTSAGKERGSTGLCRRCWVESRRKASP